MNINNSVAEARLTGYNVEKKNHLFADKFYKEYIYPLIVGKNPHLEVIGLYRFKHNGKFRPEEWDCDTAAQVSGKDGYFIVHDRVTGEDSKVYFEEKFSDKNYYWEPGKSVNRRIEIVNDYKFPGWGCKLEGVRFLFFLCPDEIIIMDNPQKLVKMCTRLRDAWDNNGGLYEDSCVSIKGCPSQKLELSKKDDPNNSNRWKINAPMSPWMLKQLCENYIEIGYGLNKYK